MIYLAATIIGGTIGAAAVGYGIARSLAQGQA